MGRKTLMGSSWGSVAKRQNEPWDDKEIDKLWEAYLDGSDPSMIAREHQRTRKGIMIMLDNFQEPRKGYPYKYSPDDRKDRTGTEHMTPNEREVLRRMSASGLPMEEKVKVLQREDLADS